MMNYLKYSLTLFLAFALFTGPWGCAPRHLSASPPSEETRAGLGTIGVATASRFPEMHFRQPMGKGAGAAYGAGSGTLEGLSSCAMAGEPIFFILCSIVAAPVGFLVGLGSGIDEGLPEGERRKAAAELAKALAGLRAQETMREHLLEAARGQTGHVFVLLEGKGPTVRNEMPRYGALADEDIDTVLEVVVQDFGLEGEGVNPPLSFFVTVRTRLVRTEDGKELYRSTFQYRSIKRLFTEWAADDARLFREEFDRCYAQLAERIADVLFFLYTPDEGPVFRAPAPEEGLGPL